MSETLFLDSSFIIALEDADDQHHKAASVFWKGFKKHPRKLITTTYIFDETITFFNRRISHQKAMQVGASLLYSPSVELVHIGQTEFQLGWELFSKYRDKGYSFTDCVSFVIIEQKKIKEALAFDEHYRQKGIKLALPQ